MGQETFISLLLAKPIMFSEAELAKWYSFPADTLTRAFFQPSCSRLWVAAEPENLELHAHISLGNNSQRSLKWGSQSNVQLSCSSLVLKHASGPALHLRQGDILNFNNQAWASLDSLGEPFYREWTMWALDHEPMPDTDSVLLSYVKCSVTSQPLSHPAATVHWLQPVQVPFFDDPSAKRLPGF